MKRIPWKWVLVLLGISLPIFLVWMYLFWDGPPPEDGDLAILPRSVRPQENGWLYFKAGFKEGGGFECWPWSYVEGKAEESVEEGDGEEGTSLRERAYKLAQGEEWDPELARMILEKNKAVLRRLDESLRFSGFQLWNDEENYLIDVPYFALRSLIEAIGVSAFAFEKEGKLAEAFEEARKAVRFGHKLSVSSRTVIDFMVASACETGGFRIFDLLLQRNHAAACDQLSFVKELLSEAPGPNIIVNIVRGEYAFMLNGMTATEAGEDGFILGGSIFAPKTAPPAELRARIFLLPNNTRRSIAEAARMLIGNAPRVVKDWTHIEHPVAVRTGLGGAARYLPIRNGIGKHFAAGWTEGVEMAMKRAVHLRLNTFFTATHIALECYRQTHGTLPVRLDDLVPRYVDAVPVDPYDGEPLRYSAEKGIVYSVGEDFKDSGGSDVDGPDGRLDPNEPTLRLGQ